MAFIGFFGTSTSNLASGVIQVAGDGGTPTDANSYPTYKIYSAAGAAMANGTGTSSFLHGTSDDLTILPITGATNATPIVITCVGHGLLTGMQVEVENVGGNTAANGTWIITRVSADTFSLDSSVGNNTYTSGGKWHRLGLYKWSHTLSTGDGYEAGENYIVVVNALVNSGSPAAEVTVTGDDIFVYVG